MSGQGVNKAGMAGHRKARTGNTQGRHGPAWLGDVGHGKAFNKAGKAMEQDKTIEPTMVQSCGDVRINYYDCSTPEMQDWIRQNRSKLPETLAPNAPNTDTPDP